MITLQKISNSLGNIKFIPQNFPRETPSKIKDYVNLNVNLVVWKIILHFNSKNSSRFN